MKRLFAILSIVAFLVCGGIIDAQAQGKGKIIKKGIELISKGAKKAPKKAAPVKNTPSKSITPKRRPMTSSTVTCSQCSGAGTVPVWNTYYQQYQYTTCGKCHGKGKVRHN